MRVALDTNILVYAEGVDGPVSKAAALQAVRRLHDDELLVPVQALGELFAVLTRKARWSPAAAQSAVTHWCDRITPIPTTVAILRDAMEIAALHRIASWDTLILAAAAQEGCSLLLTEDMQDGFTWRGVTLRNPFAAGT